MQRRLNFGARRPCCSTKARASCLKPFQRTTPWSLGLGTLGPSFKTFCSSKAALLSTRSCLRPLLFGVVGEGQVQLTEIFFRLHQHQWTFVKLHRSRTQTGNTHCTGFIGNAFFDLCHFDGVRLDPLQIGRLRQRDQGLYGQVIRCNAGHGDLGCLGRL